MHPPHAPYLLLCPPEALTKDDVDCCGMLKKRLYGTRDAALNWSLEYSRVLLKLGFTKGASSPCTFYHAERKIATAVHGDDFASGGSLEDLQWMDKRPKEYFELKTDIMGAGPSLEKELRLLNRNIRWTDKGATWEPDPRHVELIVQSLNLKGKEANPVVTPGSRESTRRSSGTKSDEEYLCTECNLIHAYGPEPDSIGDSLRLSMISEVSPVDGSYSMTSHASRRRTGRSNHQLCSSYKTCTSCDVGSAGERGVDSIHGRRDCSDNWSEWTCISPNVWREVDMSARYFVVPSSVNMKMRITRDLRSGVLLEDLWISGKTPERVVRKQLRVPRDIETIVEFVDGVDGEHDGMVEWDDRPMEPSEVTQYRALVARLNFLSIDRPDLQFCCKEAARKMSTPLTGDWKAMKRVARYLLGRPRVAHLYFGRTPHLTCMSMPTAIGQVASELARARRASA